MMKLTDNEETKLNDMIYLTWNYHHGQRRKGTNIPYIYHLTDVVKRLVDFGVVEIDILMAAQGHDLYEDTKVSRSLIREEFGDRVHELIEKCTRSPNMNTKEQKLEWLKSYRNKPIEACLIKLADRMANVEDFRSAGNVEYAVRYAAQAYPLLERLHIEFFTDNQEVLERFGEATCKKIQRSLAMFRSFIKNSPYWKCVDDYSDEEKDAVILNKGKNE